MSKARCTAVLLAAGKGSRMGGRIPKQYQKLGGIPLAAHSLKTLGASEVIDDIVLVIPPGDEDYVRSELLPCAKEAAQKVRALAGGGSERYFSVYSGLQAITWPCDYVFIHDGARPFLDEETLRRLLETVMDCGACVAGMPSKDTVKIADADGFVADTPDRARIWTVQTPQVFQRELITACYREAMEALPELSARGIHLTDDAMVAELMRGTRVKLVESSYRNLKITTPDDIAAAESILSAQGS